MDWNPRYLYRSLFDDPEKMEFFLENICTSEWNEQQDAGRSLGEATRSLQSEFPEYADLIQKFYGEWSVMLRSNPRKHLTFTPIEGKGLSLIWIDQLVPRNFAHRQEQVQFF